MLRPRPWRAVGIHRRMPTAALACLRHVTRLAMLCALAGLVVLPELPCPSCTVGTVGTGMFTPPSALAQPGQPGQEQPGQGQSSPGQLLPGQSDQPDQPGQSGQSGPGKNAPEPDTSVAPPKPAHAHRNESGSLASPAHPRRSDTDTAASIVIATLDWPPYVERHLPHGGYVVQVIRAALASVGLAARFEFMPWSRAVVQMQAGKVAGIAPEYRTAEREFDCDFSAPFPGGTLVLLAVHGNERKWRDLHDLSGLRIGVVRGYVHTDAFDSAAFLHKDPASDELANLRKLLAGRIDAMAADRNVVRFLLRRDLSTQPASLAEFDPVLGERDLHVCFSRAQPEHATLRAAFDRGLASIRAAGLLDELHREMRSLTPQPLQPSAEGRIAPLAQPAILPQAQPAAP